MRMVLLTAVLCALAADVAHAESMTFEFPTDDRSGSHTNTLTGDTLTIVLSDLTLDGVTFDATLTVVGSDDRWMTELSTDELRDLVRLDASARQPVEVF